MNTTLVSHSEDTVNNTSLKDTNTLNWLKLNVPIIPLIIFIGIITVFIFILTRYWSFIKIVVYTLPRDVKGIFRLIKTARAISFHQKRDHSVPVIFQEIAQKHPEKTCILFEELEWTFGEVKNYSNQIGNYFLSQGYKKGDVVGLFLESRPEYVCIWLGLSQIGVIPALINSQLRQQPLKHSLEIVAPQGIIFGAELSQAVFEVLETSPGKNLRLYAVNGFKRDPRDLALSNNPALKEDRNNAKLLELEIRNYGTSRPLILDKIGFSDDLFYMYTSGTTGYPKAAIVKHARYIIGALGVHHLNGLKAEDILYTSLPLYHTAGGIAALGQSLLLGKTLSLRNKFSAKNFWRDCTFHKVTVAQYIGETCRYLLAAEPCPEEKQHCVRLMFGNGLRPEIWKGFQERFNIKSISEAYGSTEGNCNMINFDNTPGAVGFLPVWAYKLAPVFLIKVDETQDPIRGKDGFVVQCKPGEWGELVGKIVDNPVREFKGYAGSDSGQFTQGKILSDVKSKGDAVFRTGDQLLMDKYGYFFFKDRLGETFRWKGENVSTAEVESVLSTLLGLKDCIVYGVAIPNTEGRAGMATVAAPSDQPLDLIALAAGMTRSLPPFARPLFLRVTERIDLTGTLRMKKIEIQKQGFDLNRIHRNGITDPVYFFMEDAFVPLEPQLLAKIMEGKIRL